MKPLLILVLYLLAIDANSTGPEFGVKTAKTNSAFTPDTDYESYQIPDDSDIDGDVTKVTRSLVTRKILYAKVTSSPETEFGNANSTTKAHQDDFSKLEESSPSEQLFDGQDSDSMNVEYIKRENDKKQYSQKYRYDPALRYMGLGKREKNDHVLMNTSLYKRKDQFDPALKYMGLGKRKEQFDPALKYMGLGKRKEQLDPALKYMGLGKRKEQFDPALKYMGLGKRKEQFDPALKFMGLGKRKEQFDPALKYMGLGKRKDQFDPALKYMGLGKREGDFDSALKYMGLGKRKEQFDPALKYMGLGKRKDQFDPALKYMGLGKRLSNYDPALRYMGLGKKKFSFDPALRYMGLGKRSLNLSQPSKKESFSAYPVMMFMGLGNKHITCDKDVEPAETKGQDSVTTDDKFSLKYKSSRIGKDSTPVQNLPPVRPLLKLHPKSLQSSEKAPNEFIRRVERDSTYVSGHETIAPNEKSSSDGKSHEVDKRATKYDPALKYMGLGKKAFSYDPAMKYMGLGKRQSLNQFSGKMYDPALKYMGLGKRNDEGNSRKFANFDPALKYMGLGKRYNKDSQSQSSYDPAFMYMGLGKKSRYDKDSPSLFSYDPSLKYMGIGKKSRIRKDSRSISSYDPALKYMGLGKRKIDSDSSRSFSRYDPFLKYMGLGKRNFNRKYSQSSNYDPALKYMGLGKRNYNFESPIYFTFPEFSNREFKLENKSNNHEGFQNHDIVLKDKNSTNGGFSSKEVTFSGPALTYMNLSKKRLKNLYTEANTDTNGNYNLAPFPFSMKGSDINPLDAENPRKELNTEFGLMGMNKGGLKSQSNKEFVENMMDYLDLESNDIDQSPIISGKKVWSKTDYYPKETDVNSLQYDDLYNKHHDSDFSVSPLLNSSSSLFRRKREIDENAQMFPPLVNNEKQFPYLVTVADPLEKPHKRDRDDRPKYNPGWIFIGLGKRSPLTNSKHSKLLPQDPSDFLLTKYFSFLKNTIDKLQNFKLQLGNTKDKFPTFAVYSHQLPGTDSNVEESNKLSPFNKKDFKHPVGPEIEVINAPEKPRQYRHYTIYKKK